MAIESPKHRPVADLLLLWRYSRRQVSRAWHEAGWAQWAVVAVFLLIGLLVAIGAYLAYHSYFERLLIDELGGPLLARYVLESSFALIFFLGIISFVVSAPGLLYRNREVRLLMALPVAPWTIFVHRFLLASLLAAWPVLFLGVPAIFALGAVLQAGAVFYLASIITLLLFVALIAALGAILAFVLAWPAAKLSSNWLWGLESVLSVLLLIWLIGRIIPRSVFTMFYVNSQMQAQLVAERLNDLFAPMPSHYFVDMIGLALPYSTALVDPVTVSLRLSAWLVGALIVLLLLAWRFYLPAWRLQDRGGFVARPEDAPEAYPERRPFPRAFKIKHSYLYEKEALLLGRDAESLSRGGFILFLMFLYLMVAGTVARLAVFSDPGNFSTLMGFVFAVIGYFALTLCMRFVFPSVSMEGSGSLALWSSPLHRHELYSWKLFFWVSVLAVPLLAAVGLTAWLFGLPSGMWLFLVFAALCTSVGLVAMTLGQGGLKPRFVDPNPDTLATSPAGLAAVGIGLGYIFIIGRYVRQYTEGWLANQQPDLNAVFGLLIVTLGLLAVYWALVPRRLETMELR
jgi:hypothetical protein